ncbi:hypothetical protein B0H10DRAFT_2230182 [Mycena sp. CBHHK59/15]|nr:hypothetical protein B0H10DRAFT_2230182 [Mycena sp. CBHHK59/15]
MDDTTIAKLSAWHNAKHGRTPSIYDVCSDTLDRMGEHDLAKHDFDISFARRTEEKNLQFSHIANGKTFSASLIVEVSSESQGTWMAAYNKNLPDHKLVLTDESSAQHMIITVCCPTGAPQKLVDTFNEFLIAVDGIRAKDAETEEEGEVTEWTSHSDRAEDKLSDILQLGLALTYKAPKSCTKSASLKASPSKSRPRHQRKTTAAPGDVEMENENEVTATTQKGKIVDYG